MSVQQSKSSVSRVIIEYWRSRLNVPAYRVGEAAVYARIAPQTVSYWERATSDDHLAAISPRDRGKGLSYLQLVEVAVVAAIRKSGVSLSEIKQARRYLQSRWSEEFPFAKAKFKTDGVDVLLDFESDDKKLLRDRLVSANRAGQLIWTEMLSDRLLEFEYDKSGFVRSWYVRGRESNVEINPAIAFGAPNVDGIATGILKDRWNAGYSVSALAEDYALSADLVSQALEFEGVSSEMQAVRWVN